MPSTMSSSLAISATNIAKYVASSQAQDQGRLTILEQLSLEVQAGERLAIVGTSGSGKSTLLALLAGLDQPSKGRISLLGQELTVLDEDARAAWRAQRVGFVFQSFQLLSSLSAVANVMLPLELTGVTQADARARALTLLDSVGLTARASHTPRQLSGGEQQRVALARAFACRPQILFADEPTGNLDTATGRQIVDLLFELNRDAGTTLVLVTHDERLAAQCDRTLRLADGRLQNDGVAAHE